MSQFRSRIRQKISNQPLQVALDANAQKRVQGRVSAFASLPDWQERRQRAQIVRADVIAHLEDYLAKFVAKVEQNGIHVHRAKDAAEAIEIFIRVAGLKEPHAHPKLIAKSKSMVSEEIGFNHALEAAGQRVVETDLGEYIVQLRGERPSHIISPAVHLRRSDVGQLFAEKLGVPYTEDIPTLTQVARKILRDVFLQADIGVSGVNFGVVETGTLTLVTNEGNGRMVTTLPPLHVALMGMERIVPTLDDLALMLSLLPRSATGQKISVYTQLIQRPELGQIRHLILLDNGRSRLLHSPLREALYCIRCGACLNACPVFREISGHGYVGLRGEPAPYPGPIGSLVSPGLLGADFAQLAQASSLCGACKEACPVDIDLPKLLTRVRAGQFAPSDSTPPEKNGQGLQGVLKLILGGYTRVAQYPRLYAFSQKAYGFLARLTGKSGWLRLPAFTGWGFSKDMETPNAHPFRERWAKGLNVDEVLGVNIQGGQSASLSKVKNAIPTTLAPQSSLLPRFIHELQALGANAVLISANELSGRLISLLKERGIKQVQAWDKIPALNARDLSAAGIEFVGNPSSEIRVGISGALAGIAETGTLVVPGGEGQPLTASLLPEIHIAVLEESALVETLQTALNLSEVTAAPTTALISGPSRTADIEMTLTIGVHGPSELYVFIIASKNSGKP